MITPANKRKATVLFLLCIVSAVGFYIRYDNIGFWLENRDRFFFPGQDIPVTRSVDSYYYLNIAGDLLDGHVERTDAQRQAPKQFEKKVSLPLLSVILALGSKISGKSLEWTAILLPPFFGWMLAIPVYLLAALLFGQSVPAQKASDPVAVSLAGLTAALFAVISPPFASRSSIGWFDTDILNVTFLCALTYAALRAATAKNARDLTLSLAAYALLTGLFTMWWDMATTPVIAFSLGYLVLAALFNFNAARQKSNIKIFAIFLAGLCLFFIWLLGESVIMLPVNLIKVIRYSFSVDTIGTHFPYAGQLAAEQQDVSFMDIAEKVAGIRWIFFLSLAGIALAAWITRQYFVFILPWLVLLLLATRSHRLMIFPGVIFGLGMGAIAFQSCISLRKIHALRLPAVLIPLAILAWFPYTYTQTNFTKAPISSSLLYDSFKKLSPEIPGGSLIWASWGHGHPLVFYTGAKTIGDGIFHPPELVYAQYLPFATTSPRLAANWICFYATHGLDGLKKTNLLLGGNSDDWSKGIPALKKLLAGGIEQSRLLLRRDHGFSPGETEDLLSFLFPLPPSPVYFLLDYITFKEQWFAWGGMAFNKTDQQNKYTFIPIRYFTQSGSIITAQTDLGVITFDAAKGSGMMESTQIPLHQFKADNGTQSITQPYDNPPWSPTLLLNQNKHKRYGALLDTPILKTVFTQMLFLKKHDANYFQPVLIDSPVISVYQVTGDIYAGSIK